MIHPLFTNLHTVPQLANLTCKQHNHPNVCGLIPHDLPDYIGFPHFSTVIGIPKKMETGLPGFHHWIFQSHKKNGTKKGYQDFQMSNVSQSVLIVHLIADQGALNTPWFSLLPDGPGRRPKKPWMWILPTRMGISWVSNGIHVIYIYICIYYIYI